MNMAGAPKDSPGLENVLSAEDLVEKDLKTWIDEEIDREVQRIRNSGSSILPVGVRTMCIIRSRVSRKRPDDKHEEDKEEDVIINRLDLATAFDFDRVRQLLISPPIPCAPKVGFRYCHIVIMTDKKLPLLMPYVFPDDTRNTLQEWLLVNSQEKESRHSIQEFNEI